MTMIA